jgi:DNA replication protein DnaC
MPSPPNAVSTEAALPGLLKALGLPTITDLWRSLADTARSDGWTPERYLAALCEHELQGRDSRRIARRLQEANLPHGKRLDNFDYSLVPGVSKARIRELAGGGEWIANGHNLLIFGPHGVGKTHLASGIGAELVAAGHRVRCDRVTDILQLLQAAKRDLGLPAALARLDRFDCLILDDIGYARKDHHETDVLFELISERYERRSLIVTSNQPFGQWETLFQDKAMTVAAIDRLVHHATIIEISGESHRRREALAKIKR